jgi:hypothetical protein
VPSTITVASVRMPSAPTAACCGVEGVSAGASATCACTGPTIIAIATIVASIVFRMSFPSWRVARGGAV